MPSSSFGLVVSSAKRWAIASTASRNPPPTANHPLPRNSLVSVGCWCPTGAVLAPPAGEWPGVRGHQPQQHRRPLRVGKPGGHVPAPAHADALRLHSHGLDFERDWMANLHDLPSKPCIGGAVMTGADLTKAYRDDYTANTLLDHEPKT